MSSYEYHVDNLYSTDKSEVSFQEPTGMNLDDLFYWYLCLPARTRRKPMISARMAEIGGKLLAQSVDDFIENFGQDAVGIAGLDKFIEALTDQSPILEVI